MKIKKVPRLLLTILLTGGAGLIIGLLSFSGMFSLFPILALAFVAFGLSVAYEGEIYLQNIKGALGKLFFKRDYLKNHLAGRFLLEKFSDKSIDLESKDCPQFFTDYFKGQLKMLGEFSHKTLDKESRQRKKQVKKTLRDMEKWFAQQLFPSEEISEEEDKKELIYVSKLQDWLKKHGQDEFQERLQKRRHLFHWVKGFSILSGIFMGVGISYLLVEAFSIIPLLMLIGPGLLPVFIVPMALIAGIAYGMLVYNSVTDMINNDTLRSWYTKIKGYFQKEGFTVRTVFVSVAAVGLLALTIALTVCTAGTWWTIAKNSSPLFGWMAYIPSFVMGIINPTVTGSSQLIFNLENTAESFELIDDLTKKENFFHLLGHAFKDGYKHLMKTENWLQRINPFRLLLKITITPLRLILFLGHIISTGVNADQVPGVPKFISVLLGIISEGFEDAHYFLSDLLHDDHDHAHTTEQLLEERFKTGHSHDHSKDLPTLVLQGLFSPLYFLAAVWDSWASKGNTGKRKELDLKEAFYKQMGWEEEESVTPRGYTVSDDWRKQQVVFRIENHCRHLQGALVNKDLAKQKIEGLQGLRKEVLSLNTDEEKDSLKNRVHNEGEKKVYKEHRFFNLGDKPATQELMENLERLAAPCA